MKQKELKAYMVTRKEIHDYHVYIRAESASQARKKVFAGKGHPSGVGYSGELPPSCWQVEEMTDEHKGTPKIYEDAQQNV